jgi:N-acetylmuramoyl-L-alanine amidase
MIKLNKSSPKNEYEIYLTRYKNNLISLSDRTKLAKAINAVIFISLLYNNSNNTNARGLEVYVSSRISQQSKESVLLSY